MDRKTAFAASAAAVLTVVGGASVLRVAANDSYTTPPAVITEYVDQNGNPVEAPGALDSIVIVIEQPPTTSSESSMASLTAVEMVNALDNEYAESYDSDYEEDQEEEKDEEHNDYDEDAEYEDHD